MREPSIHITRRILRLLIHEWFKINKIGKPAESLVIHLMERGVNYAVTNRIGLAAVNEKGKKRINRVVSSPTEDALKFANTLSYIRTQLGHRGVTKYTKAHRDWEFIVELSGLANEFCESFELSKKEGYAEYIRMFFDGRSGAFKLRMLKSQHEALVQRYEAKLEIEADPNKESTERAYETYQQLVYEATGINFDYRKMPDKYRCFVKVAQLAKDLGVNSDHFVIGNFETLASFATGIPSPEQLITNNGIDRVIKWKAENREALAKTTVNYSAIEEFKRRIKKHKHEDSDL